MTKKRIKAQTSVGIFLRKVANPRIVLASPFQGDKEVLPNTAKRKANTAATKLDETANAKVTRIDSTTTGEALKRGGRKS